MTELPATDDTPWYAGGLSFECLQCGRCCAGPEEGYVWVTEAEVSAIAEYLGLGQDQMLRSYVRRSNGRCSLRERSDNRDCVFLMRGDDGRRTCAIYAVRPTQCRIWPFWPVNLASPDSWSRAGLRCRGMNRGANFTLDEIQARRDATRV